MMSGKRGYVSRLQVYCSLHPVDPGQVRDGKIMMMGNNPQRRQALNLLVPIIICSTALLLLSGCGSDKPERLKIGDEAPPFSIVDMAGVRRSSEQWQGHPVILRFWDTECKYCRADSPIINRYFDAFRDRGLEVLYVATPNETVDRVRTFIEDLDIGFPVALDEDGEMTRDYQVNMVPQTIFISPEQKIITAMLGGVGEAELEELVGPYLNNMK